MKWQPFGLVLLSVVPTIAGIVRLVGIFSATGAASADDARFVHAPGPIVLHVVATTLFGLIGAFQFSDELRRRAPRWHRVAGRVLAVAGLIAGVTGLWMAIAWDIPAALQGPLLLGTRVVVGVVIIVAIALAWRAIVRRDVRRHEAWMIRAWAVGLGAGTQVLVLGVASIVAGHSFEFFPRDVLMLLAWVINAVIAELVIARRQRSNSVAAANTGSRALRAN
ncbi:MAG: DUF2306 domain-containing protein [Myxococcaceae bacterium]